jgi:hypothetical protein
MTVAAPVLLATVLAWLIVAAFFGGRVTARAKDVPEIQALGVGPAFVLSLAWPAWVFFALLRKAER